MIKVIILIIAVLINVSSTVKAEPYNNQGYSVSNNVVITKRKDNTHARKYFLGPNDIINVNVLGSPELSQSSIRVHPDGKINLTYLDGFDVTGLTTEELQEHIKNVLSEYVVNPQVSISITQQRPFIVYVSGAILNPGSYELNTITNSTPFSSKPEAFIERKTPLLSNIIVAAGGVRYDADLENVQVINDIEGSERKVNLYEIFLNGNSLEDIYLMGGDRIFIPKLLSPMAINEEKYRLLITSTFFQKEIPVRVIGYVNSPGLKNLPSSQSGNLNSAIAAAGGYASDAHYMPKKVFISRLDNNNKLVTREIDPRKDDVVIMPNDIIYVPEKLRPIAGRAFDFMARAFAPFSIFSNVYNTWDVILKR